MTENINLPEPDYRGPDGSGEYFNGYTAVTVRRLIAEAKVQARREHIEELLRVRGRSLDSLEQDLENETSLLCAHTFEYNGKLGAYQCLHCGVVK